MLTEPMPDDAVEAARKLRVRPHTVLVWSQTPLTGRAYRLVRLRARLSPGTPLRRGAGLDRAVPAVVGTPHHLRRRRRRLRGGWIALDMPLAGTPDSGCRPA
ncbi:hypothetical protein [Micromonospora sp. IBSANI012]|uniref:hypothetical protein n=1 Tax=Micromonospora sp. IBSANI012 TaxID=3457761 RepID=UPI004059D4B8